MTKSTTEWGVSNPSRPRGILNEQARKYLLDASQINADTEYWEEIKGKAEELDIEPGSARERELRQRIRKWVIHAIFDFQLLAGQLEERDKRMILNDDYDPDPNRRGYFEEQPVLPKVRDDLPIIITFIYQMYQIDSQTIQPSEALAETVRRGIESAHATAGEHATADVNIEVSVGPSINEIADRFDEEGAETLTEEESWLLYTHDKITVDEYTDILKEINQ